MVDKVVHKSRQDGWRENSMKTRRIRVAIRQALATSISSGDDPGNTGVGDSKLHKDIESETDRILELVKHQNEY